MVAKRFKSSNRSSQSVNQLATEVPEKFKHTRAHTPLIKMLMKRPCSQTSRASWTHDNRRRRCRLGGRGDVLALVPSLTAALVVLLCCQYRQDAEASPTLQLQPELEQEQEQHQHQHQHQQQQQPLQLSSHVKRSFCNTFGGCGLKRSLVPGGRAHEMASNSNSYEPKEVANFVQQQQQQQDQRIAEVLTDLIEYLQSSDKYKRVSYIVMVPKRPLVAAPVTKSSARSDINHYNSNIIGGGGAVVGSGQGGLGWQERNSLSELGNVVRQPTTNDLQELQLGRLLMNQSE